MNKKVFLTLVLVAVLALVLGVATVNAAPKAKWDWTWDCDYRYSGYCGSGYCGYSRGYGYWCAAPHTQAYQAEFITDVTAADGTYVAPGTNFLKVWRVKNIGICAWPYGTQLVFVSGDRMGASGAITLPYAVAPGQTIDISVNMVAPSTGTSAKGEWMLQAPDGTRFGVGCNSAVSLWVQISTISGGCSCLGYSACSCGIGGYNYNQGIVSPSGSRAGRNPYCNNKVRSVSDITIPDGTTMAPGTIFRKTWRMKNGGTCEWDANYVMMFAGGDNLGGAEFVRLSSANIIYGNEYKGLRSAHKVYPGDYLEISIDLKAPSKPGTYQAYYKLRDSMGYEFGFGSYAAEPFWVKIVVVDDGSKPKNVEVVEDEALVDADVEAAPAVEAVAGTEVPVTVEEVALPANSCGAQDISLKKAGDGQYSVVWSVENNGSADWTDAYKLVLSDANPRISLESSEVAVPGTAAGDTAEVSFPVSVAAAADGETDPLWLEFYITDGNEDFCKFYFEIPE